MILLLLSSCSKDERNSTTTTDKAVVEAYLYQQNRFIDHHQTEFLLPLPMSVQEALKNTLNVYHT